MANIIDECITLKDSDHRRMIFILSKIQFDADTFAAFMNFTSSILGATLSYRIKDEPGQPARAHYLTDVGPLHMNYDDPLFPNNHRITVKLYAADGATLVSEKYMDTKDSPVLR